MGTTPHPAPPFLPCGDPEAWGEAGLRAGAACRQGVTVPGMAVVTHRAAAWHRRALGLGRSRRSTSDATSIILATVPTSPAPIPDPLPAPGMGSNREPPCPPVPGGVLLPPPHPTASPSRDSWGNRRGQHGDGDATVPSLLQTSPPSPSQRPSARTPACPAAPSPGDACAGSPSPAPTRLAPTTPSPSSATAWAGTRRRSRAGTRRRSPTAGLGAESPSVPWDRGTPACPCC